MSIVLCFATNFQALANRSHQILMIRFKNEVFNPLITNKLLDLHYFERFKLFNFKYFLINFQTRA